MDSRILKKKEGVYMENDYFPILVIPAIPNNGSIRFLHPRTQYDIGSENAEDVWKILSYCNGFNSIEDVAALSGIDVSASQNEFDKRADRDSDEWKFIGFVI